MTRSPRTSVVSQYVNCLLGVDAHRPMPNIFSNISRSLHHCGAQRIHAARTCRRRKNTFRNSVKWTTFDLAKETHTRIFSVCATCSTRATTALTSDGEQSSAKRKPPSADTDWQQPQMSKLQRKTTLGSRSFAASRATHHQMSGTTNCLCQHPPWVNGPRRACQQTILTTRDPAASHPKPRQPLRASLGHDSNVRHQHV